MVFRWSLGSPGLYGAVSVLERPDPPKGDGNGSTDSLTPVEILGHLTLVNPLSWILSNLSWPVSHTPF